jgi:hypothetical protein
MSFQDRTILHLDENPDTQEAKGILKLPLKLVKKLGKSCFTPDPHRGILKYEQELDSIKKRAGLRRRNTDSGTHKGTD